MPNFSLSMLRHSSRNMRTVVNDEDLDELMASMLERHRRGLCPLIQNLRGVQVSPKKIEIHAGGRRLSALLKLRNVNQIPSNIEIPVELDRIEDAVEVSIMENTLRVPPHPYDQFVGFKKLHDQGLSPEQIAQRFGTKAQWVKQRLALAGLHPELLELLKKDELPISCAQALTLSSDQQQQLDCWMRLSSWERDGSRIKRILRDAKTPVAAAFFPIEEYVKAGGIIERDLFDDKDKGTIGSPALFAEMQRRAVDERIAALKADGWGEVIECDPVNSWYHYVREWNLDEMDCEGTRGLTPEEQEEYDTLTLRYDEIQDLDPEEYAANQAALDAELQKIDERLEALGKLEKVSIYSDEQRRQGVVLVLYSPPNNLVVRDGYMRPQPANDEPQTDGEGDEQPAGAEANDNRPVPAPLAEPEGEAEGGGKPYASAVLMDLAKAKSHAIQDIISTDFEMSVRVAVYHLLDGGYNINPGLSQCDSVSIRQGVHSTVRNNDALIGGMKALARKIGLADDTVPGDTHHYRGEQYIANHPDRWLAIRTAPFGLVSALFSYLVARSVGVHAESMRAPKMYSDIVELYGLRMVNRWRPDLKFFTGLTKGQMHDILRNNRLLELSERWKDCKKPDLVEHMTKLFDGLPPAGLGPTAQAAVLDLIGTWVPAGLDFYTPAPAEPVAPAPCAPAEAAE